MNLQTNNWNYPTTMWVGNGRIKDLVAACQQLNINKPLFVTDTGLANLEIVSSTLAILNRANIKYTTYSDVAGNPSDVSVINGLTTYENNNNDGVIAFGGGSALDVGKTIALMVGQTGTIWDYEDVGDNWRKINPKTVVPIIAVPTTAGTGSEVGRAAVITDEVSHSKKIIFHPKMLPTIIISDPELTLGLPANITAWTGVDALVHAVEAYCAPSYHPMADGIAIEAIRIIKHYLPIAVADGSNLEARGQMLIAASMAATAFQKGLGSIHSVAHTLGGIYNSQHGLTNAILFPYGIKQNSDVIYSKMDYLCKILDLTGTGTNGFIDYLINLRAELKIPHTLNELGIDNSRAVEIGKIAFLDPSTPSNAKPVTATDLQNLFEAAVAGDFERL